MTHIIFGPPGTGKTHKLIQKVEEYIKNGKIKSECLYSFDKITINGTINQDLNESYDSCIEIVKGLFIVMKTSPSDKHIKRINEGIYYREPILI